ncbi:hypothetical protein Q6335_27885, partial [Klebsiella pneumoniae]|uniref:hypothetical protein n=1 Tax=Klebsiella pneumoniae TaxID=573 RepID=UPI00272F7944
ENEALVIPEADIEYLKDNADNQATIRAFDKMHGAGQAQSILTQGSQPAPQENQERGAMDTALYYAGDTIQGIGAGLEDV